MTGLVAKPFTAQDWQERFTELGNDVSQLIGYSICVDRSLPVLKDILEKSKNFDELKKELLFFIVESQNFTDDFTKKLFSDNPEQYGLPSFSI